MAEGKKKITGRVKRNRGLLVEGGRGVGSIVDLTPFSLTSLTWFMPSWHYESVGRLQTK